MDSVVDQVKSVELGGILKSAHSPKDDLSCTSSLVSILRSVSPKFSVAHVSFDLLKYIKAVVVRPLAGHEEFSDLIALLTDKFQFSFRPAARDVIELVKSCLSAGSLWSLGDLLILLRSSLGYHQGNPKNTFLAVADDFLPLVKTLPDDIVSCHQSTIQGVIGVMFEAGANMHCLSAYLASKTSAQAVEAGEPSAKRRKSASGPNDVYVSRLFSQLNASVSKMVMSEFVAGRRPDATEQFSDSLAGTVEDKADEEFSFFSELLARNDSFLAKIELWKHMSDLRIYRLRDEHSDTHRSALQLLLDACPLDTKDDGLWRCLGTVVSIDPVSFTDSVTERIFASLASLDSAVSRAGVECVYTLFRTFAVKGSFCDLAKKISDRQDLLRFVDVRAVLTTQALTESISAIDLIDSVEFLLPLAGATTLVAPLIELCFHRLPENLLQRATTLVSESMAVTVAGFGELTKSQRPAAARQLLVLVDALRKVRLAYSDPMSSSNTADVEEALTVIAKKDASHRCAALVRLALLCNAETTVADIIQCEAADIHVAQFVAQDHVNAFALTWRFRSDPDWKQLKRILVSCVNETNFKAFPETLVHKSMYKRTSADAGESNEGELETLLSKTDGLLLKFPRVAFTPISLRRNAFPADIVSLELAWANKLKCDTIAALTDIACTDTETVRAKTVAVYGLCVILEEAKRNKALVSVLAVAKQLRSVLERVDRLPPLVESRFVLALHGLVPEIQVSETSELLAMLSHELLSGDIRDRPAVDAAYFSLFQALVTGTDRRRVRIPWWCNKMPVVLLAIRGLIGSSISGCDEETKLEAAQYVARLWKTIIDSLSAEKFHRLSKSIPILAGEYIRLSSKIANAEAAAALDKGCCALLDKLSEQERQFLHAMLGKTDRETLRRLVQLLDRSFKYKGKI